MKALRTILATVAVLGLAFATASAQLPQYYSTISVQDFTVVNDSTSDSTFSIGGNGDVDTSLTYDGYLWKGVTLEGLSNSAHADSAGVTYYLMGSLRGVVWTQVDSLLITVDNTPTFKAVDLRAGRYRFYRFECNGIASTGNAGDDGGVNEPVAFLRIFRWSDR